MKFQPMSHLKIVLPKDFPKEDGLQLMLRLQRELNETIYPIVLKNIGAKGTTRDYVYSYKQELTKEYLLAIIRECCEALDMINSKPWKRTPIAVNQKELKFEFIDIQHFILSLYDIWHMDKNEVIGIFLAKYKENKERVKNGY